MIGILRDLGRLTSRAALTGAALALAIGFGAQDAHAQERYAALIIDAGNGNVLFSRNAEARRYPASLTKMMTLYLVFEDMSAGRIRTDTPLKASANAAAQAPSKLGLKAGETITVEQAIRALVTKSANDVAVVVAENLGGSVSGFADRMNRTARSIGMTGSTFRNPHGLPDDRQYTTARDMATLAIQTQRRFPQYYAYYQTRSFTWKGATYANHNKLLGRVAGVDGMKTGYIRASGFNLVSSMRRDGRHIVGVVMGGKTGASRDAHMRELLEGNIKLATVGGKPLLVNAPMPPSRPDQASLPVRTSASPGLPTPSMVVPSTTVPGTLVMAGMVGKPLPLDSQPETTTTGTVTAAPQAASVQTIEEVIETEVGSTDTTPADLKPGEWIIQVGAFNSEELARNMLDKARQRVPGALESATAFTETTSRNGETLWRARFAGFDQPAAEDACALLKRQSFGCFPARN